MSRTLLKSAAAMAVLALGLAATACNNGAGLAPGLSDGVPLADLDTSGPAPTRVVLAGADTVIVNEGAALTITADGDADAVAALRFSLEDGTIAVMRERDAKPKGVATVTIAMPPARELVLAGSGAIRAATMTDSAEINLAGSGRVAVSRVAASSLRVNLMGSGTLDAAGTARQLDFNLAGSGRMASPRLKVDTASVTIAGSGGGEFASDGSVEARIAGSGEVTVNGRATCKISAAGSGKIICRGADGGASTPAAPVAPLAPPQPREPE